jgi:hypothetical protein
MSKTNGYHEHTNRESQANSNRWLNIGGIVIIIAFVLLIVFMLGWARDETTKHTMTCDPMKTNIIGMDIDTVKKVCGDDPWSAHYEGLGRNLIKITLHYTGGDIFVTAHGDNQVSSQVTGWSK